MTQPFIPTMKQNEILILCATELEHTLDTLPEESGDLDTYSCSREELIEAIRTAATATARQVLFADYRFREHLSMITNHTFT